MCQNSGSTSFFFWSLLSLKRPRDDDVSVLESLNLNLTVNVSIHVKGPVVQPGMNA